MQQSTPSADEGVLQAIYSHVPVATSPIDAERYTENLKRIGIPHPRSESWKYTNPRKLLASLLDSQTCSTDVQVNGAGLSVHKFSDSLVTQQAKCLTDTLIDHASNPLASINGVLCQTALIVEVLPDAEVRELRISGSSDSIEKYVIVVHEHARLTLYENGTVRSRVIECILKPHACVNHIRLQESDSADTYNLSVFSVGSHAKYQLSQSSRGGRTRRNELIVNLDEPHAQVEMNGGWKIDHEHHIDNQVTVNHNSAQCKSRMNFRGFARDKGKSIFNGRIYIAPGAQGSDAVLNNKNLAEGLGAQVYTKPELEIYANDVLCAHGATTGQLNADEIFYLKSRGVNEETAKQLLVNGFLKAVVNHPEGEKILGLN